MNFNATIQTDHGHVVAYFEPGEEIIAADIVNRFAARLKADPAPVAEQAPTQTAKALLEAVSEIRHLKDRIAELEHPSAEQKIASGTPRKPRGAKAPKTEEPAPVVTMSHEVSAESASTADAPEAATTIAEEAQKLYEARGYDGAGQPVTPAAEPAEVQQESAQAPTAEALATEEEQTAVVEAFAAAGMSPLKQHEYLTTVYPGVPSTVGTLKGGQARAIVALLASKAKPADTPATDEAPPLTDDDAPPIDWDGPLPVDLDAPATPSQAEEVREQARALKIAPGDARAILREAFNVGTPDELTAGQARRAVDTLFPDWAANALPF